jgi:pimeloyl-ACP methyl ester carboxylesterase
MIYEILKKPFFGRFMVKWKHPEEDKLKDEWTKIIVNSKSGGKIVGLFGESKNESAKATIVLGHPMGKEAKGYFIKHGYAELLLNNGFNVLLFDINGFGQSSHGNFSFYEDIVAVGVKAASITPTLPIGYHGISLGGQFATIAFADQTHAYDFAIVESAATTLPEFWRRFPFAYAVLSVLYLLLPKYGKKINMLERIKEAKRLKSLLLIYSKTDDWVPISMGERFKKNSPVPTELWTVEEAGHAQIMKSKHKSEYENKIVDFFNDAVNRTPKRTLL